MEDWPDELERAVGIMLGAAAPIAIYWGPELVLLYNDAWRKLIGAKHPDALGRTAREVFPEIWEQIEPLFSRVLRGEPAVNVRRQLLPLQRNGALEEAWFDFSFNPLPLEDGSLGGVFNIAVEVTEQVQAEAALRGSEERLRRLVNVPGVCVLIFDAAGTVVEANDAFHAAFGYTREEVENRALTWQRMTPPEHHAQSAAQMRRLQAEGRVGPYEKEYFHRDGSRSWVVIAGASLGDGTFAKYCIDVSDRKRAEQALREATGQLEKAGRRKDEFLATLAHELRNPLAPLRTGLDVLKMRPAEPAVADRARGMMDRQLRHLVRLVDDLLDMSRITCGKLTLQREPLEMLEVVRDAVEAVAPAAEQRTIEVDLPPGGLLVEGDRVRLVQVVLNLLNNAVKFTAPDGWIRVQVARAGEEVRVSVTDDGAGIAEDLLPHVFDLFRQDHGTQTEGLGIGLALVHRLAELHGGHVSASSAGPGEGAEFTLHLPLRASVPDAREAARAPHRAGESGRRVLVVDDNRDAADSLAMLLEGMGMEVRVAYGGAAALEALAGAAADVVFLDLAMPEMDGFEVARRIRGRNGEDITLVAVTGYGQEADRRRAQTAGFDQHLVKPVALEDLRTVLVGAADGEPGEG
jgi:PAS domain S-box-containing protein